MVATCTAVPLEPPLEVTTAVRDPKDSVPPRVTVSCVVVAAVTVAVPELKATVSLAIVVEKPVPVMIICGALTAKFAALLVTVGAAAAFWDIPCSITSTSREAKAAPVF